MIQTEQRTAASRDEHRRALERLEVKQQIIADLIAGRLPLLDAAARFRDAHANPAEDGERLCRVVIGWVYLTLSERPERAEALANRLEQELQVIVSRQGLVRLP